MTGQELYARIEHALQIMATNVSFTPWFGLGPEWRNAIDHVASGLQDVPTPYAALYAAAKQALNAADHVNTLSPRDYRALLKEFGRHAPSCPAAGPCTCGFEAVEKEL